jgi:hypothetical protein
MHSGKFLGGFRKGLRPRTNKNFSQKSFGEVDALVRAYLGGTATLIQRIVVQRLCLLRQSRQRQWLLDVVGL